MAQNLMGIKTRREAGWSD